MKWGGILVLAAGVLLGEVKKAEGQVNFGIKAGVTNSMLYGSDAGDVASRGTVLGGAFLKLNSGGIFAIQPEFLLVQKGATNYNGTWNVKQEFSAEYLEIPLLLKLQIPLFESIYPHVFAGPYGAYKLHHSYRAYQIDSDEPFDTKTFEARAYDYGGVVGAGLDLQGDLIFVTGDVRYTFGLPSIDAGPGNWQLKNRGVSVMAGIGVRLF